MNRYVKCVSGYMYSLNLKTDNVSCCLFTNHGAPIMFEKYTKIHNCGEAERGVELTD